MISLEQFTKLSLVNIDEYLSNSQEENISLEFKTVNFPSKEKTSRDFDKKNYSKALSGFGNSIGGLVVWGIEAKKNEKGQDFASEKKPIKELKSFLNFLNTLEGDAITPLISGIRHRIIEEGDDVGYALTYVPASENPPHIANFSDKHYYKRSGDSFYKCEHFDIRDMFFRSHSPKLEFSLMPARNAHYEVEMKFGIANTGKVLAKYPFIQISINQPYYFSEWGLDGNKTVGLPLHERAANRRVYTGTNDHVIFPSLTHLIDTIVIKKTAIVNNILPPLFIESLIIAENMERIKVKEEFDVNILLGK